MGHSCPTCGKELNTKQGMRQHHTKVHGDPLPNRTCKGCGTEFHDSEAKRTFCDDCNPEAGKHNGNWKGAKEEADCRICGETFEYYPSDKEGVFCPTCVEESDEFLGTPSWELRNVERLDRECDQCSQQFRVLASFVEYDERNGRFCSHECRSNWMSENWQGENHHQWMEGETEYSGRWWEVRQLALEHDDYSCQSCGATTDEIGREPDVHHIKPVREFDDPQDAHYLENVVCLCRTCHPKVEWGLLPVPEIE